MDHCVYSPCCSHVTTRHLFYLQLRRDVIEGRVLCDVIEGRGPSDVTERAVALGALALQAEYEDSYERSRGAPPEQYLCPPPPGGALRQAAGGARGGKQQMAVRLLDIFKIFFFSKIVYEK